MFEKPSIADVHSLLRSRKALIVHFSGVPGAGNTDIRYPEDLRRVISGGANSGVSCSVVSPGDIFAGAAERNAYGTIGVILDLRGEQSLATATHGDGGSLWYGHGAREFDEKDLTIEDLERSLTRRDGHNEWGFATSSSEVCSSLIRLRFGDPFKQLLALSKSSFPIRSIAFARIFQSSGCIVCGRGHR
jgi:hypothetical protein